MLKYPKKRSENFDYRARLISQSRQDEKFQSAFYAVCANDILFWINTCCWLYDAKGDIHKTLGYNTPHMLFLTFPFQDEYILKIVDAIKNGKDKLTEKSRDMGISWIVVTIFLWFWMFQGSGNDFLIGSRKEEFVDKQGSMKALFPKIRYQLNRQVDFMLPLGFDRRRDDNYMRLLNPENGNSIDGESNNKNFGTGARYKAVLFDEYAKWEHTDEAAWQSCSDVTNCKLPVSSAFGRQNHFYRLRSGKAGEIEVIRLHWRNHPLKNDAWYENEKKRRSPQDLAAEVDIDYSASISNKAYESFKFPVHCAKPYPEYSKALPLLLMCDFNVNPMCWAIGQEYKDMTYFIDEIYEPTSTRTEVAAKEFCKRYEFVDYKSVILYGDASGRHKDTRSKTTDWKIIADVLESAGWSVVENVPLANPGQLDSINVMNKRLCDWEHDGISHVQINPEKCPNLVDSFEQTRKKDDGTIDKSDNIEHMTDGPRYYAHQRFPIVENIATGLDI